VLDLTRLAELKQIDQTMKQQHGFTVSAIGSYRQKIPIPRPFEPHIVRFRRALEVADWLKSSYVRIFFVLCHLLRLKTHQPLSKNIGPK
jgi:hypothetical protein